MNEPREHMARDRVKQAPLLGPMDRDDLNEERAGVCTIETLRFPMTGNTPAPPQQKPIASAK